MMKHYVLLKLKADKFHEGIVSVSREILGKLVGEVSGLISVNVHTNCIDRADNYDLMIEMDLANEETLYTYLDHPYHQEFIDYMGHRIETKVSFDYKLNQ